MESVIALAEFGKRLKVDLVIDVVKGVNPHLVRRYFKRFNKTDISPGEVFVLRQFIRVVDGPARQNILRILAKVDDPIHRLYFAAATFDPSEKVKAYLAGSNINISSSDIRNYKQASASNEQNGGEDAEELEVEEVRTDDAMVEEVEFFQEMLDENSASDSNND